jgi:hypothetical protein
VHLLGENVEDHRKLRLVGVPVQLWLQFQIFEVRTICSL